MDFPFFQWHLGTIFERNDKQGTGVVDGLDLQYMIQDVWKKSKQQI